MGPGEHAGVGYRLQSVDMYRPVGISLLAYPSAPPHPSPYLFYDRLSVARNFRSSVVVTLCQLVWFGGWRRQVFVQSRTPNKQECWLRLDLLRHEGCVPH